MWRGIVGKPFTAAQFDEYVRHLRWGEWVPKFVVVHNTSAPTLKQWHGPTPPEKRMLNLENYYKNEKGWKAGPHLFVADDFIWVFTPLTVPGVHSPSWNSTSIGMEIVGEYDYEDFALVRGNVVSALVTLHRRLGIDPDTLRFHKEDPATTHKRCPGKNIVKAPLVTAVKAGLLTSTAPRPADVKPIPRPVSPPAPPDHVPVLPATPPPGPWARFWKWLSG